MCLSSSHPSHICLATVSGDENPTSPLLCSKCCTCHENSLATAGDIPSLSSSSQPPLSEKRSLPLHHQIVEELKALSRISGPSAIAGLLIYIRNLVSMLFLGRLGQVELAAGSLSLGFANITGYSIIFGLAMGMEPICGQAYGARKWTLLSLTLHRTVVILLFACLPISLLWINIDRILLFLGQDPTITKVAHTYLLYCLPDLIAQAFLHPLRIYLRSQNITRPIAIFSIAVSLIHIPLNYLLVIVLGLGIKGVGAAIALSNFILVFLLICYIYLSGVYQKTWTSLSLECMREWRSYLSLAIPSCISICLEWWWYEFMIILCGLFANPEDTIAAIGILIQATSLIYVFPSSLSFGVSTRVAQELGAGRPSGARRAAAVGTTCGALLGIMAMGFAVWARGWWGHMFTGGPGVLKLTVGALPMVGLCELGNCPQTTMCGVMRGSARPKLGAHVNLGAFYGVGLPMALGLGFLLGFGFKGLWLGLLGAQLTCAVVLGLVLVRTDWGAQVTRAEEITGAGKVANREGCDGYVDVEKLRVMDGGDEEKGLVCT